jgi:16S rRNA processing protein RimM
VIRFDGIDDRTAAEALRGRLLTADAMPANPDELLIHELIGRRVVDQHDRDLGEVRHVEANPAHDILVTTTGVLIPIVFVRDDSQHSIRVEVPDGLVELYLES